MLVEDVMTDTVETCDIRRPLRVAIERMLEYRIGSIVVTDDGDPCGIITETDVLAAGLATGRPPGDIEVATATSRPLITIAPGDTVRKAVNVMHAEDVKKLPVVEDLSVVGILTRSDLVYHYGSVIDEARRVGEQRSDWTHPAGSNAGEEKERDGGAEDSR